MLLETFHYVLGGMEGGREQTCQAVLEGLSAWRAGVAYIHTYFRTYLLTYSMTLHVQLASAYNCRIDDSRHVWDVGVNWPRAGLGCLKLPKLGYKTEGGTRLG